MYKKAIEKSKEYIRPMVSGVKYYGSNEVVPFAATFVILNEEGWLLTCKHVATNIIDSFQINANYQSLIDGLSNCQNKGMKRQFEKDHKLNDDTVVLVNNLFPFKIEEGTDIEFKLSDKYDLALVKFNGIKFELNNYPVFSSEDAQQGQGLCKLGFPFPEVNIFGYDDKKKEIFFKDDGTINTPCFPLDGIVTRNVIDETGRTSMFEMSSPGLMGQSGGPIFDEQGIVYGIQSGTSHIDLGFDKSLEVIRGSKTKIERVNSVINLGRGIASSAIREFLDEFGVKYSVVEQEKEFSNN